MSDSSVERKRFTWLRIAIALTLVAALAVVGWWNWPRGDARFVGRWTFDGRGGPVFELRRNGTAIYYVQDYPVTWYWATWDGNFSFGWPSARQDAVQRANDLSSWTYERLKFHLNTAYEQYKIISVSPDVIEMQRWIGDKETTRLIRIHDE